MVASKVKALVEHIPCFVNALVKCIPYFVDTSVEHIPCFVDALVILRVNQKGLNRKVRSGQLIQQKKCPGPVSRCIPFLIN